MSDSEAELDLKEQIARIDRMIEESRKFAAEQHKLAAEQNKLAAEQNKLAIEAVNLRLVRWVTPVAAIVGALAALTAAAPVLLRGFSRGL